MSISKVLDEKQMMRALTRMSHEILENNKGTQDLILVGIKTRGEYLATFIQQKIEQIEGVAVPIEHIDISGYRDDIDEKTREVYLKLNIDHQHVILIDDVLYTGRTVRAAMDALLDHGRPKKISLATLIDRGHRELPIRADFVGKNIPTSKEESIHVYVKEIDDLNEVTISKGIDK